MTSKKKTTDLNREILVTQEGYDKLVADLENYKNVKRKEVAAKLKEAISYGDLSENSEYEEAKNEQAFVEGRILELEAQIKNAKIVVDTKKTKGDIVQLGSTLTIVEVGKKEEETYTLVGSTEANIFENKISNESPLGQALLDKKAGDVVSIEAPKGKIEYKVVKLG